MTTRFRYLLTVEVDDGVYEDHQTEAEAVLASLHDGARYGVTVHVGPVPKQKRTPARLRKGPRVPKRLRSEPASTYRALTRVLHTHLGIYPAGTPVQVVGLPEPGQVRLCLDPYGWHLNNRCHAVTAPKSWVR